MSAFESVEPIKDQGELIDCLAQALEIVTDPIEVERILDAISRFGVVTNDFEDLARPLAVRLNKQMPGDTSEGIATAPGSVNMDKLLQVFLNAPDPKRDEIDQVMYEFYKTDNPGSLALGMRIEELIGRIKDGQLGPLLSLPTHQRGWIEPSVFANRLTERLNRNIPIQEVDFLTALLRLAPDCRDAAFPLLTQHDSRWAKLASLACNAPLNEIADPSELDKGHLNVAVHVRTSPIAEDEMKRLELNANVVNGGPPVKVKELMHEPSVKKPRNKTVTIRSI